MRTFSTHSNKEQRGLDKLLEDIMAQKVVAEKAREIFGQIAGACDRRVGDAHPTSSKIGEALKLAGIDENSSSLRQGDQLIPNVGQSIGWLGKLLFQSV
ncbi:hypothetical protein ACI1VO_30090 [Escherichia coli]|uniref:hypothetical protein n=1 Tax=Escherichia coli TaxID=562 RepID=UPI00384B2339